MGVMHSSFGRVWHGIESVRWHRNISDTKRPGCGRSYLAEISIHGWSPFPKNLVCICKKSNLSFMKTVDGLLDQTNRIFALVFTVNPEWLVKFWKLACEWLWPARDSPEERERVQPGELARKILSLSRHFTLLSQKIVIHLFTYVSCLITRGSVLNVQRQWWWRSIVNSPKGCTKCESKT